VLYNFGACVGAKVYKTNLRLIWFVVVFSTHL